jgi:hypothetical protein
MLFKLLWHHRVALGVGLKASAHHLPCEPTRPIETLKPAWSCGLFEHKGVSSSRVSPPGPLPHLLVQPLAGGEVEDQARLLVLGHVARGPQRLALREEAHHALLHVVLLLALLLQPALPLEQRTTQRPIQSATWH